MREWKRFLRRYTEDVYIYMYMYTGPVSAFIRVNLSMLIIAREFFRGSRENMGERIRRGVVMQSKQLTFFFVTSD